MDSLYLYDTYTKSLREFKPLEGNVVKMYNCGPTVYDHPHIGNFRAFIFADLLRRYLEYKGFNVLQVMNITDVGHMVEDQDSGEDKIQLQAIKKKKTPQEIAEYYTNEFFELVDKLNLRKCLCYPKATEHIQDMISAIKGLIDNGYAYEKNGAVYFEVDKFKNYGRLSGNTLENLIAGKRVEIHPDKKKPYDFALWKYDPKHIMKWHSPWSEGFPGWHIECSVMAMKYLGETIDIHTGGEDNLFPHHESEIAQAEALTGKKFVNFWLHVKHLLVNGQKMSKSLGNFYTVNEILEKGYHPIVLRYFLLSGHYRQNLNFTFDALESAREAVSRLYAFKLNLQEIERNGPQGSNNTTVCNLIEKAKTNFGMAMDEDINIAKALSSIFEFIRNIYKLPEISRTDAYEILKFISEIDSVIGVLERIDVVIEIPDEIKKLVKEREEARNSKNYQTADRIRQEILKMGFILEDTHTSTRIIKKI